MKNNQNGFGIIAGLLVIVVLCVVGFSGWYVTNKKNEKSKNQNTTKQDSRVQQAQSTTPDSPATEKTEDTPVLTIKEWGVRIVPAKQLPKVTYSIDTQASFAKADINFGDLAAECEGMYWFSRAKSGQDIDGYGTTPEKYMATNPALVKKLDDYFYYFGHGQAGCSDYEKQNQLVNLIAGDDNTSYKVEPAK